MGQGLPPEPGHQMPQVFESMGVDQGGALLKIEPVSHRPVNQVCLPKPVSGDLVKNAGLGQYLQQTDIVRPANDLRMIGCMLQHQVLHQEFDVHDAAPTLLINR